MQLLTAILGAAQGLRGELKADIRTDNPTKRFKKGTVVKTDIGLIIVKVFYLLKK